MSNHPQKLVFTGHGLRQMALRGVSVAEVRRVVETGEIIAQYPEDRPYPSNLLLAFFNDRPLHVLLAIDEIQNTGYIVTAYEPDPAIWESDFRTRRKP